MILSVCDPIIPCPAPQNNRMSRRTSTVNIAPRATLTSSTRQRIITVRHASRRVAKCPFQRRSHSPSQFSWTTIYTKRTMFWTIAALQNPLESSCQKWFPLLQNQILRTHTHIHTCKLACKYVCMRGAGTGA